MEDVYFMPKPGEVRIIECPPKRGMRQVGFLCKRIYGPAVLDNRFIEICKLNEYVERWENEGGK